MDPQMQNLGGHETRPLKKANERAYADRPAQSGSSAALAAELAVLKKAYDKAYQNLRYLRGRNKPYTHALLATRRLLREAWMAYLALPVPMRDSGRFGTGE